MNLSAASLTLKLNKLDKSDPIASACLPKKVPEIDLELIGASPHKKVIFQIAREIEADLGEGLGGGKKCLHKTALSFLQTVAFVSLENAFELCRKWGGDFKQIITKEAYKQNKALFEKLKFIVSDLLKQQTFEVCFTQLRSFQEILACKREPAIQSESNPYIEKLKTELQKLDKGRHFTAAKSDHSPAANLALFLGKALADPPAEEVFKGEIQRHTEKILEWANRSRLFPAEAQLTLENGRCCLKTAYGDLIAHKKTPTTSDIVKPRVLDEDKRRLMQAGFPPTQRSSKFYGRLTVYIRSPLEGKQLSIEKKAGVTIVRCKHGTLTGNYFTLHWSKDQITIIDRNLNAIDSFSESKLLSGSTYDPYLLYLKGDVAIFRTYNRQDPISFNPKILPGDNLEVFVGQSLRHEHMDYFIKSKWDLAKFLYISRLGQHYLISGQLIILKRETPAQAFVNPNNNISLLSRNGKNLATNYQNLSEHLELAGLGNAYKLSCPVISRLPQSSWFIVPFDGRPAMAIEDLIPLKDYLANQQQKVDVIKSRDGLVSIDIGESRLLYQIKEGQLQYLDQCSKVTHSSEFFLNYGFYISEHGSNLTRILTRNQGLGGKEKIDTFSAEVPVSLIENSVLRLMVEEKNISPQILISEMVGRVQSKTTTLKFPLRNNSNRGGDLLDFGMIPVTQNLVEIFTNSYIPDCLLESNNDDYMVSRESHVLGLLNAAHAGSDWAKLFKAWCRTWGKSPKKLEKYKLQSRFEGWSYEWLTEPENMPTYASSPHSVLVAICPNIYLVSSPKSHQEKNAALKREDFLSGGNLNKNDHTILAVVSEGKKGRTINFLVSQYFRIGEDANLISDLSPPCSTPSSSRRTHSATENLSLAIDGYQSEIGLASLGANKIKLGVGQTIDVELKDGFFEFPSHFKIGNNAKHYYSPSKSTLKNSNLTFPRKARSTETSSLETLIKELPKGTQEIIRISRELPTQVALEVLLKHIEAVFFYDHEFDKINGRQPQNSSIRAMLKFSRLVAQFYQHPGKEFAGVCVQKSILSATILNLAGFDCRVARGFIVKQSFLYQRDAHAQEYIVGKSRKGELVPFNLSEYEFAFSQTELDDAIDFARKKLKESRASDFGLCPIDSNGTQVHAETKEPVKDSSQRLDKASVATEVDQLLRIQNQFEVPDKVDDFALYLSRLQRYLGSSLFNQIAATARWAGKDVAAITLKENLTQAFKDIGLSALQKQKILLHFISVLFSDFEDLSTLLLFENEQQGIETISKAIGSGLLTPQKTESLFAHKV